MILRIQIFLVAFALQGTIIAQEQLSLSDAIQMGLANNFGIRIEQTNRDIARNNNTWGQAGRYPSIELSVGQNNNITDIDNPASFLQGQIRGNDLNPVIAARWTIFDGFSVNINKRRLELLESQSDGNVEIVIEKRRTGDCSGLLYRVIGTRGS